MNNKTSNHEESRRNTYSLVGAIDLYGHLFINPYNTSKMKLLFLLLLPCCMKAQDTTRIYSRSSNPSGTVWLTTTDPRITLQYVGTEKDSAWYALASKGDSIVMQIPANYKPKRQRVKKQQQLILCGTFTHMKPIKQ